jgi:transcriptional regulator of acetoin/glycerol metabolism
MAEERRSDTRETAPVLGLVHSREPLPFDRIALRNDLLLIGREVDDGSGISTGDARMSRVHVRILPDRRAGAAKFRISDAHSRNGTFVNGARIESALLADGDVVRIGDCLFVYTEVEPMARVRALATQFSRALPASLLIEGKLSSGRRRLARQIHTDSEAGGTLTESLAADGGSALVLNIDAASAEAQAELLHALQTSKQRCVFVTASDSTRIDPPLYAALAHARIELPPLRARKGELLSLLLQLSAAAGNPVTLALNADAAEALLLWPWPGNFGEAAALFAQAARERPGRVFDIAALRELAPAIIAHALERKRSRFSLKS